MILVLAALLAACGTSPGVSTASSPARSTESPSGRSRSAPASVSAAPNSLDGLLADLAAAVRHDQRTGFLALVSGRDPGFTATAEMIFDNLHAISPGDFSLSATGTRRDLSKSRAAVLGRSAYAAQVRVTWSVPGDRAPSDQQVWMTVLETGSGLQWAGIVDGPPGPRATPLWWLEPVHYAHNSSATVITGDGIDTAGWLAAATTAVGHDVPLLRQTDWNHRLVIIIPSNERLLEESLGVAQGADSALAGITWPDGTDPDQAPFRIMINAAGQPDSLATSIVLAHETVHVATRSPISVAPTWLVEGYADYIAYLSYPQGAQAATTELLAAVKQNGPPSRLPDESDFGAGNSDLNLTYAQAWSACRYLSEQYGSQRLWDFYHAVDTSPDGSIAGPARSVFGISQQQLVTGWQQHLRTAARTGRI